MGEGGWPLRLLLGITLRCNKTIIRFNILCAMSLAQHIVLAGTGWYCGSSKS